MKLIKWFIEGIASINLFPVIPDLPQQTDTEAIASVWRNVGDDLRTAIEKNDRLHD